MGRNCQETIKRRKLRLSSCLVPINFQPFFSLCVILLMHHFLPFLVLPLMDLPFILCLSRITFLSFAIFYVSLTLDLQDFPELLIPNQAYLLFIVVSGQIWDLQPNPLSSSRFPFLSDPHLKDKKGSSESRKWWRNGWKVRKIMEQV